ncbi:IclR family transcriptional regulator [Nocardioides bruguierae]|uniref:IclR family transcriptional regulator n=1 Tax=Nocardioides bruguierae TaxID=2945102 RepID=A0A9X2D9B0_9ACTN|nr:IclR family transcriptional regulator [Nocardioides bruguierae]MCM0621424.1 IclR family transcriptional regulator [Nocardioides bruguierae]
MTQVEQDLPADDGTATRARGKRPPQGEPVIDRAFALLDCFDLDHRFLTLGELSRRSGIPASSALRLAGRLMAWGALERDDAGRFSIGVRLWEVASLAPRGHGLRDVALPYLHDLAEATREHVLLAVRDERQGLLVERISGHRATEVLYRVGGRLPLHSTGVGLVLLAFAEPDFTEPYLDLPLRHDPEQTLVDKARLRRTLAEVRRERIAIFRRAVPSPVLSVAAPIWDADDTVAAALSVVVPDQTFDARRLAPAVQTAARAISRALGAQRAVGRTT